MNNKDFASYCKSKAGCYYWFGTFGQKASKALYLEKKKQYPKYYTASDFEKQIANPKQCFDCAGLIKSIILLVAHFNYIRIYSFFQFTFHTVTHKLSTTACTYIK